MKRTLKTLAVLAAFAAAGAAGIGTAAAQNNNSATGSVTLNFIQQVGIYAGPNMPDLIGSALNFGNIIPGGGGTLTMDNTGHVTYYSGSQPPADHTVTPTDQMWEIKGEPGYQFTMNAPSAVTPTGTWPSGMTFTPNTLSPGPYTLDGAGKLFLGQGGTLVVPATGVPLDVTFIGTWSETVAYY